MPARSPSAHVTAWALYDWANSAFITTVIAGFFPIFFKSWWSAGLSNAESTSILGTMHGAAGIIGAILSLGVGMAASTRFRFRSLLWASILVGSISTILLCSVPKGMWVAASAICIIAQLGFSTSLVCYDSLLPSVSVGRSSDRVSAFGYSLGYLGGGLQFLLCILVYENSDALGFPDQIGVLRVSFFFVGIWWLIFSLPLLLMRIFPAGLSAGTADKKSPREFLRRLRSADRLIVVFLISYWIYIDGVNSVVKMAVDYGMARGLPASDLITALLITQFVGFPATFVYGMFGARIGTRPAILCGLAGYAALTLWSAFISTAAEFFTIAVCIGLLQGGVQSLSRSLFARIIPQEETPVLFGAFNMVSKFASVLGPVLIGLVTLITGRNEIGVLSLIILFAVGGYLLYRLPLES